MILIQTCASSRPFLMMYSKYKLNKQGDNIQPWHTPFPTWNQSVVPCPVLTVASWPAYSFSRGKSGGLIFPFFFQNFPHFIGIYTVKAFGIVNKVEIAAFLEPSWFSMTHRMFAIWFLVPLTFKLSLFSSWAHLSPSSLCSALFNSVNLFDSFWMRELCHH